VIYAADQLGLTPTPLQWVTYAGMILCGLAIHYATLLFFISLVFWIQSAKGVEGGYFALNEFSRLPREALRGIASIVFVYALPLVVVTNVPAQTLRHGLEPRHGLWLAGAAALWLALAVLMFHRGLRRYTSASS
jgi:ABC-2 type transport system permease protein